MPRLPATGTVSYNGITFPGPITTRCSILPIYTMDDRAVKYRRYLLTIECILVGEDFVGGVAGGSVDAFVPTLRQRLLEPGKTLSFTGQGLGSNLIVTPLIEAAFGPKPRNLEWKPIGSTNAIHVVWTVEFTGIECVDGTTRGNWFGELTYEITANIGENLRNTRTITGLMERLVFRGGDGHSSFSGVDDEEGRKVLAIVFPLLPGYLRAISLNWSSDRRSLRFTITDREIESDNPYPPGCVQASFRHLASAASISAPVAPASPGTPAYYGGIDYIWRHTFTGNFTIAPGLSMGFAWRAYLLCLDFRLKELKKKIKTLQFIGIEIHEDIFSKTLNVSTTFTQLHKLEELLSTTGMLQPVPGSKDWRAWSDSVYTDSDVIDNRRQATPLMKNSDDVIFDFCGGHPSPINTYVLPKNATLGSLSVIEDLNGKCPPEDESYIGCKILLTFSRYTYEFIHSEIGGSAEDQDDAYFDADGNVVIESKDPSVSSGVVIQPGGSVRTLVFWGAISRLCFDPKIPIIKSVGRVKPAIISQNIRRESFRLNDKVRINNAYWLIICWVPDKGNKQNIVIEYPPELPQSLIPKIEP